MINPKELRIGNWIRAEGEDSANIEINQIGFNTNGFKGYWVGSKGQSILLDPNYNDLVSGIPLTHEMLEKAGFKKGYEENDYYIELFNETVGEDYFILFENDNGTFKIPDYDIEIKSVHQLQNLFHALTGEELEIKL